MTTDNDRDLLEKAAKAADIYDLIQETEDGFEFIGSYNLWNPLTDDGDALRLAVKLRLRFSTVCNAGDQSVASATDFNTFACVEDHKGDPYAATRRAIVRAAAMIGESM